MMLSRETVILTVVLSLSIGSGVLWYMRERGSNRIPPPPSGSILDDHVVRANADAAPRLDFAARGSADRGQEGIAESESISVEWRAEEQAGAAQSGPEAESPAPQLPELSTLTLEDILAFMDDDDQETLQALLQALIAEGNASLPLLDAMLHSGRWRAERMAIMALSRIDTTEARLAGVTRLLTREEARQRGWHRLAAMMGRNLNGEMVDLLAAMAEDAEGDARRRMLMLMHHVRDEDGLFRLYMLAEEHPDPAVRRAAVNTVFRGRRAASVPLLQDIMMAHENPEVAGLAAIGLARGGRVEGIEFLAETGSSDQPVAELAIRALEQVRSPRSHGMLSQIAGSQDYGIEVRLAAVQALGNSARPGRARRFLAQVAENADVQTVREAATALLEEQTQ